MFQAPMFQARVSRKPLDRTLGLPQAVRDIAWKGQLGHVPALPASDGGRQTEGGGDHGNRPRDGRLHPGYCANRDTSQHLTRQRH